MLRRVYLALFVLFAPKKVIAEAVLRATEEFKASLQ